MWSPHCVLFQNSRSKVKVVGHRKVKNVFLVISRRRIVVESRDWRRNVGELIDTTFVLTFCWSVTNSFQDRPGSKFGPPIENEKNCIFCRIRVHPPSYLRYMQPDCTTYIHGLCGLLDFAIPRTALVF